MSLRLRFMLVVIAGATLFALIAAAFAFNLEHRRALGAARATLDGLADAVEKTTAVGAFASDQLMLQEIAAGLARNPLVAAVDVLNAAGVVLAHQSGRDPGSAAVNGVPISIERPLASPFNAAEKVGLLRIAVDVQRVEKDARADAGIVAALIVGQTALVALLLYAVAQVLVSGPIVQLGRSLRTMPAGSSERLVVPAGHARDEIGLLVSSANALLGEIEATLQRERELRASVEKMEAQYRQIFDSSSAGIFVLDLQGRLINSNPTAHKVIGLPVARMRELQGDDFVRQVFARPERVHAMIRDAGERLETVSADVELLERGGRPRWVHCLISVQATAPAAAEDALVEAVIYDVTERKRAESAVLHAAEHDSLTGLKNRGGCEKVLKRFIDDATATSNEVSVLFIDLDGFKRINDTLGHAAGDQVLRVCAKRLLHSVRRVSDVVGRLGGDEFIVLLNHVGPADALAGTTAANILASLREPITLDDGSRCNVGASIGIACFPRHGRDAEALMEAADGAMYEVKRSGKNALAMAREAG